jgi:hypothetical protein
MTDMPATMPAVDDSVRMLALLLVLPVADSVKEKVPAPGAVANMDNVTVVLETAVTVVPAGMFGPATDMPATMPAVDDSERMLGLLPLVLPLAESVNPKVPDPVPVAGLESVTVFVALVTLVTKVPEGMFGPLTVMPTRMLAVDVNVRTLALLTVVPETLARLALVPDDVPSPQLTVTV